MAKGLALGMFAYVALAAALFFAAMLLAAYTDDDATSAPHPLPSATATVARTPTAAATATAFPTAGVQPTPTLAVPTAAQEVTVATFWPGTETTPSGAQRRLFYSLRCDGRTLAVSTTREAFFAELDCSSYWLVDEVVRPYLGKAVSVTYTTSGTPTLSFEVAGTLPMRFQVVRVWRLPG